MYVSCVALARHCTREWTGTRPSICRAVPERASGAPGSGGDGGGFAATAPRRRRRFGGSKRVAPPPLSPPRLSARAERQPFEYNDGPEGDHFDYTGAGEAPSTPVLPRLPRHSGAERAWLAGEVRLWLDSEWEPLEVHRLVGERAADAALWHRRNCDKRREACDLGSLVLAVATELDVGPSFKVSVHEWHQTYVNAFDVANKVSDVYLARHRRDTPAEMGCERGNGVSTRDVEAIRERVRQYGLDREPPDASEGEREREGDDGRPRGSLYEMGNAAHDVDDILESWQDLSRREEYQQDLLRTRRQYRRRGAFGAFAAANDDDDDDDEEEERGVGGLSEAYIAAEFDIGSDHEPERSREQGEPSQTDEHEDEAAASSRDDARGGLRNATEEPRGSIREMHAFDRHLFFMGVLNGDVVAATVDRAVQRSAREVGLHEDVAAGAFSVGEGRPAAARLSELALQLYTGHYRESADGGGEQEPSEEMSDEQAASDLDLVVETLHGEEATRMARESRDEEFAARAAAVWYFVAVAQMH